MEPADFLRANFEPRGLTAFAAEDFFGEWASAIHVNKAVPPPAHGDLSRLAAIPDLRAHLDRLDGDFKKFTFGRVNLAEWDRRYQVPRESTIRAFLRKPENRGCPEGLIVNRDLTSIERWVKDALIPTVMSDPDTINDAINVLIGPIGSGKSTLNKLVTSKYFDTFKANRIVASRVEYKKLDYHVSGPHAYRANADDAHRGELRALIEQVVYCNILRDLFHFNWSEPRPMKCHADAKWTFQSMDKPTWPEFDLRDGDAQAKFVTFLGDRYGTVDEQLASGIDTVRTIKEVRRAIAVFSSGDMRARSRWYYEMLADTDRQAALEPFAQYAAQQNIKLFVIFDGLDWVQISDFISHTTHRENLNAIANWLINSGGKLRLPKTREYLYPTYQVTMRPNTYELFWRDYSQALSDLRGPIYYIVPAEFRDIVKNAAGAPLFIADDGVANVPREDVLSFFSDMQLALAKVLDLRPRELSDLFMQNVRYRVHFARNVLEELFHPALETLRKAGKERSRANLLEQLRIETTELLERKEYRLVDMLMHAKNERFANFIRIEGDGIDLQRHRADPTYLQAVLRDNNIKSGYVGNVFNYHIPYRSRGDVEFLLEKLRILDLLIASKEEPLGIDDLLEQFAARNWVPSPYFDFSIAILIRENMVSGFNIEAGASGYVATSFGKMIRSKLVTNMVYLENVFFGTYLPRGIKRSGKDVYRNSAQRHEWVAASIYHCWLFLRLIRTAEKGSEPVYFEEVRASVAATIERIITAKNADPRIARYAMRYIEEFGAMVDA